MNVKRIFSVLLLFAGEALIILGFLNFGRNLDRDLLTLNIIVSSIIYALFFVDLLFPILNLKDKTYKAVGSLGIRWVFSTLYILFAVAAMVIFTRVRPVEIESQYIIHAILFFFLLLGLFFAFDASGKVKEVFREETQIRSRVDDMKKATKAVQLKLDQMKDIRADIIARMTALQEDLRYITPSNNQSAYELETSFLNKMGVVHDCLFEVPLNNDKILDKIQDCERTYMERKQVYSN